jgi:predicted alpha-1,2-mannosidase
MRYLLILSAFIFLAACQPKTPKDPIGNRKKALHQLVNPFIGTGGHGHTYPGAVAPFGMLQVSPDSRLDGWDGCSAYHYSDEVIYGFSHTHLSGTGVSDYGDLLLMPMIGEGYFNNGAKKGVENGYAAKFSHDKEMAEAGYYKVELENGISVELTAGQRVGMQRYSFPKGNKEGYVILDLEHRDQLLDVELKANGKNELLGFRRSNAWATDQHFYFVVQFNQDFEEIQFQEDSIQGKLKNTKALLKFKTKKPIIARVGASALSLEGARKNLEAELKDFDFDVLRKKTQEAWDTQLAKVKIKGGTEDQQTIFYTALYHNFIVPNLFSDVDGQYRGLDGQVHQANHKVYTIFSLWDTYRATHPLYNLVARDQNLDFVKTMLLHYKDGGKLPVWELAGNETNCMIGYHSVSVIADAYNKGLVDFDTKLALEAMQASALNEEDAGLKAFLEKGFIEMTDNPESVSKTLEYSYDNWCIAQFAKAVGQDSIYQQFMQLAQAYKGVFDPSTNFMRARVNGGWFHPFSPAEVNFNYTEANAWQYSLYIPQDVEGWMNLAGGPEALSTYLDSLFLTSSDMGGHAQADITGLIGQYAHGNEPSHHMAYLYNYAGQPNKTQERTREILTTLYQNAPDGLSGNEDCGQMSAWFVFSSMGFYPLTPGSDIYAIGSPLFDEIALKIGDKPLKIIAKNNSKENIYIQSLTLNGKEIPHSYLSFDQLQTGGELIFEMGPKPSKWATAQENWPKSSISEEFEICIPPYFKAETAAFSDSMLVEIAQLSKDSIFYWTGDEEGESRAKYYDQPFTILADSKIFTYAVNNKGVKSKVVKAHYRKTDPNRKIDLKTEYADRYAGGGKRALIDGLIGGKDYRSGYWQGYQGQDLNFVVDLGEEKTISYMALSCLQDQKSWIWTPRSVLFELSSDGENFRKAGLAETQIPVDLEGSHLEKLGLRTRRKARYIRVSAKTIGQCPPWHLGAGGDAWIFADELLIEAD